MINTKIFFITIMIFSISCIFAIPGANADQMDNGNNEYAESYEKALDLYKQGKREESANIVQKLINSGETKPDLFLLGSTISFDSNNYSNAIALLNTGLEIHTNNVLMLKMRGKLFLLTEDWERSTADLEMVIKARPDDPVALNWFMMTSFKNKDYSLTLMAVEKLLAIKKDFWQAHNYKACCYAMQGMFDNALEIVNNVLQNDKNNSFALAVKKSLDSLENSRREAVINYNMHLTSWYFANHYFQEYTAR